MPAIPMTMVETGIPDDLAGPVPVAGIVVVWVGIGVAAKCEVVTTGVFAPLLPIEDAGSDMVPGVVVTSVVAFSLVVMA